MEFTSVLLAFLLVGVPCVLGLLSWLWLTGRLDGWDWVAISHAAVILVLVLTGLVVAGRCLEAARGDGGRIGSKSIAYRSGPGGVVVNLESMPIDPANRRTARDLNARGLTSGIESSLSGLSFQVAVPHPAAGAAPVIVAVGAVGLLPWVMGLMAIERIIRRTRRGEPFSPRSVRDLRWLAFAVSGAVYAAAIADYAAVLLIAPDANTMLNIGDVQETIDPRLTLTLAPLIAGALVLALAEVWRRGIALREDADATI